jgi:hypothetical protein
MRVGTIFWFKLFRKPILTPHIPAVLICSSMRGGGSREAQGFSLDEFADSVDDHGPHSGGLVGEPPDKASEDAFLNAVDLKGLVDGSILGKGKEITIAAASR